jgi:hypothetical protein
VGLFEQVEIVVAAEVATALQAAFPGVWGSTLNR